MHFFMQQRVIPDLQFHLSFTLLGGMTGGDSVEPFVVSSLAFLCGLACVERQCLIITIYPAASVSLPG